MNTSVVQGEVWFLDVGQGHAAIVSSPNEVCIVDCPRRGVISVKDALAAAGVVHVAAIFVTHRDLDHCGGVPELLDAVDVGAIYMNFAWAVPPESAAKVRVKAMLSSIFSKAERDALPIRHVYAGESGSLGQAGWVVLAPTVYDAGRANLNDATNRASLVLEFALGTRRFLIMGDADHLTVGALLADAALDLNVDVLLVSHHGALLANLDELLVRTAPTHAVISVGRVNAYAHPHGATLTRIAAQPACRLLCTQVNHLCHVGPVNSSRCAGTVHFLVYDGDLLVEPDPAAHDAVIDTFDSPRCR
jgi:competence protein ComEC